MLPSFSLRLCLLIASPFELSVAMVQSEDVDQERLSEFENVSGIFHRHLGFWVMSGFVAQKADSVPPLYHSCVNPATCR